MVLQENRRRSAVTFVVQTFWTPPYPPGQEKALFPPHNVAACVTIRTVGGNKQQAMRRCGNYNICQVAAKLLEDYVLKHDRHVLSLPPT